MKFAPAWMFVVLSLTACKSKAEKACFEGGMQDKNRVSSCGELCDSGNQAACGVQSQIGQQRCFKEHDAETCRWMCHYAKDGTDLYCKEYEKITGKPAE